MDRLISLQAAIDVASGYCHPANIVKELAKLPSAQPEQRWIPCSERLPEMKKPILVTYETEDGLKVERTLYDRFGFLIGEAIAWMPLPEPWRGEGD